MKKLILVICALLPVMAFADRLTKEEKHFIGVQLDALKRSLKDPDSAKFRDVFLSRDSENKIWVCGEVNAKNTYGGYVGFQRFVGVTTVDGVQGLWEKYCDNKVSDYTVK